MSLSVLVFIGTLTPVSLYRRIAAATAVAVLAWAMAAVFGISFQCQLPLVWKIDRAQCVNRLALYLSLEIVNAVLAATLVFTEMAIVGGLQLLVKPKLMMMGVFASRLL